MAAASLPPRVPGRRSLRQEDMPAALRAPRSTTSGHTLRERPAGGLPSRAARHPRNVMPAPCAGAGAAPSSRDAGADWSHGRCSGNRVVDRPVGVLETREGYVTLVV